MKVRRNVKNQEAVTAALWKFAANLQLRPNEGQVATLANGADAGARCSLKHVAEALSTIMETFGYQVSEIQ